MGAYIETGSHRDKAAWIIKNMKGEVQTRPHYTDGDFVTVCVVDNGPFEAAAVGYTEKEFNRFIQLDPRDKVFLTVPRAEVVKQPGLERLFT